MATASSSLLQERAEYYKKAVENNPELRKAVLPRLNKYIAQFPTEKQAVFLLLNHKREGFYGGAGGGGKSSALLQAALQYVDVPGYSALILRRTFKDLSLPNAIMDRARAWLMNTDAHWNPKKYTWVFPTKGGPDATLTFGYLQHDNDVYQYDSAEFQFVGFDEVTQFSNWQYRFLFARTRKLRGYPVPVRTRAASNPGGIGHQWVKERFLIEKKDSRFFIPARMEDNPYLDVEDYRLSLAELDPVMRAQREFGDWDVNYSGAMFKRQWFGTPLSETPAKFKRICRYWDWAATIDGGDWTVGTKVGWDGTLWYVLDVVRGQWGPSQVESIVKQTAATDGRETMVRFEQEPGSSGKTVAALYMRLLSGYDAKPIPSTGSKVVRWRPFAAQCEANNVRIISAPWNNTWIDEMCAVPESKNDDQADATSGAFNAIAQEPKWEFGVSRLSGGRR